MYTAVANFKITLLASRGEAIQYEQTELAIRDNDDNYF